MYRVSKLVVETPIQKVFMLLVQLSLFIFLHSNSFLWCTPSTANLLATAINVPNYVSNLHVVFYTPSTLRFTVKYNMAFMSQPHFSLILSYNSWDFAIILGFTRKSGFCSWPWPNSWVSPSWVKNVQ